MNKGPALVSNVPFDSVAYNYTTGAEYPNIGDYPNGSIIFKSVRLEVGTNDPTWGRPWWDLTVPIESVNICLIKDVKDYTILDVINIYGSLLSPIAEAEKVVVKVTSKADFNFWTKFLVAVKKKHKLYEIDQERRKRALKDKDLTELEKLKETLLYIQQEDHTKPIRVLPPQVK